MAMNFVNGTATLANEYQQAISSRPSARTRKSARMCCPPRHQSAGVHHGSRFAGMYKTILRISKARVISVLKGVRCSIDWQRGQRPSDSSDARDTGQGEVRQSASPSSSDCLKAIMFLTAGAIDHQDAGSQRPSSASTLLTPRTPRCRPRRNGHPIREFHDCDQGAKQENLGHAPGPTRCSSFMIGPKPRRPVPGGARTAAPEEERNLQRRERKVVNANLRLATEIQPCCNERTANRY